MMVMMRRRRQNYCGMRDYHHEKWEHQMIAEIVSDIFGNSIWVWHWPSISLSMMPNNLSITTDHDPHPMIRQHKLDNPGCQVVSNGRSFGNVNGRVSEWPLSRLKAAVANGYGPSCPVIQAPWLGGSVQPAARRIISNEVPRSVSRGSVGCSPRKTDHFCPQVESHNYLSLRPRAMKRSLKLES